MSHAILSTPSLIRWASTPLYASEQQIRGENPHSADGVHALGVMLYLKTLGDIDRPLNRDSIAVLERKHVCRGLICVITQSVASDRDDRYQHAGELAEALRVLPSMLIVDPDAVPEIDPETVLYEELDRRAADGRQKNDTACGQLSQRDWAGAVQTLESIFHPALLDVDLYTRAVQHRDGKRFVNDLGIEFALVPSGSFWMGDGDGICGDTQVTIDQDFCLGVYPVTQEDWQTVMGSNPSHFRKGGPGAHMLTGISDADLKRFPVESVSWDDCQEFLWKLNERAGDTGWLYRLPREAEWEYACQGAATTRELCSWNYYFREPTYSLSAQQANFAESALGRTCRVGSYEANVLGLYDMHGNDSEWCEDCRDVSTRWVRGGSYKYSATGCQSASRDWWEHSTERPDTGIRLARVSLGR